jgi:hypothetical protein
VIPTGIDVVQVGTPRFRGYGNFGNPAGCTVSNSLFVKSTHPQYSKLYAIALSAVINGKAILGYAHRCEPLLWYSVEPTTYNIVTDDGSFSIRN